MMFWHFLQRILKTLPLTFSSAIEYLVLQLSQMIFIFQPRPPRAQPYGNRCANTKRVL